MKIASVQALVLAAGKATRFKTTKNKLLAPVCGRPMVLYPLQALNSLGIATTVIVGHQAEALKETIAATKLNGISYVTQTEQLGTGHAVASSQALWNQDHILVLNGDLPLITPELIENLILNHLTKDASVSLYATHVIDPHGYGRVITADNLVTIVEEKDCTPEQREVTRINAGVYLFKKDFLTSFITKLGNSNAHQEYYLPDLINFASQDGLTVEILNAPFDNLRGTNTLEELWAVEQIKRSELISYWMSQGVRFSLAQNVHIDVDCEIGADSFIGAGVILLRGTKIGNNCNIGAYAVIENSTINDNSTIHSHSVIEDSTVGSNVSVGPFARLRNNAVLGDNVGIGNFVEIKNSTLGESTKAKHLAYLGDATIGQQVNIGAGSIICNWDGVQKHRTVIKDKAYIGANNTLVAPLEVGTGAYTAAGSTITQTVPANDLAIARSRQVNKTGYAEKIRAKAAQRADNKTTPTYPKAASEEEEPVHIIAARKSSSDCDSQ